jgi:hypothetical protein
MIRSRAFPLWLFVLAFAFVGALERAAAAAEPQASALPASAQASSPLDDLSAPFGFTMTFAVGGVVDPNGSSGDVSRWQGGFLVGTQGLFHYGLFEAGGTADVATGGSSFITGQNSHQRLGAGVLAGTGLHFGRFYPEALAELGTHAYAGIGPGDGVGGTVPYAGVRLTLGLLDKAQPGRHDMPSLPQIWLFARQDLGSREVTYQWQPTCNFLCWDGPSVTNTSTAKLGGVFELGLAVGGGFDVR